MGRKGNGVVTKEDISVGQFIVEYVGEVMRIDDWVERNKKQKQETRKNYFFIATSGVEGIDASCKGNLARFINHSCDPNCFAQKWWVLGETRIGIFARKNITKGTELTYDYQWEGFGRQKCLCQSVNCTGIIGVLKDIVILICYGFLCLLLINNYRKL